MKILFVILISGNSCFAMWGQAKELAEKAADMSAISEAITELSTQSETPIIRHPTNSNIMFASANTYNVGGSTTFSTGCYKTTDGGVTWSGSDTTNFNFGDPAPDDNAYRKISDFIYNFHRSDGSSLFY